jgi:hypothetical protein
MKQAPQQQEPMMQQEPMQLMEGEIWDI